MTNQTLENQTPFFETFFSKNKKLFLFLPLLLVGLLITLYFTSAGSDNQETKNNTDNVDVSLPNAEQKPLSDNKIDAMDDFNQLSDAQSEADKKSNDVQIDDISSDGASQKSSTTYQQPNDEVVNKIDKMIAGMDNKPKKEPKYSSRNYSSAPVYNNGNSNDSYTSSKENNTKETFDDFFNSSSSNNRSNVSSSAASGSQEETFAYAVIKGDQLGLRNNSRVTLILPKDAYINGIFFKKNTIFYSQANFSSNNRVMLVINNIQQKPVNIKAYDAEDGSLGLQVRQSVIAESSKEMVQDGTDEINVSGVPLGNTLKRVFKRKQQEIKVDLLNNQKIILK